MKLLGHAASALADAGIEACVTQRKTDFESPAMGVLIEALRLANARHDRDILRRLCLASRTSRSNRMPSRRLPRWQAAISYGRGRTRRRRRRRVGLLQ